MGAAEELDAHLAGEYDAPEDEGQRQQFRVEDDRMAMWAQHKLSQSEARLDEITKLAADRIAVINAWAEEASRPLERDAAYFSGLLADYLRRLIEPELLPLLDQGLSLEDAWAKVRRKGHPLPGGRLQARKMGGNPKVVDEDTFVAWALEHHPELLRHKPAMKELGVVALVKDGSLYTKDGESVPGTVVEPVWINFG